MINNVVALTALRATVATVVTPASAYEAFILNGGRVTKLRPSLRGMNAKRTMRIRLTHVAKSRG